MCGIVGIIGTIENKEQITKKMNDRIIHRGPDDEGFFYDDTIALAMRRLSIIDIEHGKQPITSIDGRYTIVFNGEIYNYKILKDELIQKGYTFQTNSDTEVILVLYQHEQQTMLPKLRGMFSFAIFDKQQKTLFLARDYFGIKPLYYIQQNNSILAFGSEIKSLLEYPSYKKEINDEAVYNYLSFQYNPLKETFFKNIWNLLPGHFLSINTVDGSFIEDEYWSFVFNPKSAPLDEVKDTIEKTLVDSVDVHMIADVPVGCFLSGGIDSGIIATLASDVMKTSNTKLSTFTIGFKEANEWSAAREIVDTIKSDHQEILLEWKEYFSALPIIAWHFDEPVADPSAIAIYFLAREARKKVKVVLSGEGADELFGGYNIYLEPFARRRLQYIPKGIRKLLSNIFTKLHISTKYPHIRGIHFLERSLIPIEDRYIGNATIFTKHEVAQLWTGKKNQRIDLGTYYAKVHQYSDSVKMQYIDINTWLKGDILAKADKMSMAHSLEIRVPFLDREVARVAETLTDNMKWRGHTTKYLLRKAVQNIIPQSTRTRKKLGFPTPVTLMIKDQHIEIEKIITENSYNKEHFNLHYIRNIISDHSTAKKDNARKIFALLMFSIWYEQYFTQPPQLDL